MIFKNSILSQVRLNYKFSDLPLLVSASLLLFLGTLFVFPIMAQAAIGDLTINVTRESDDAALAGATVWIDCDDDDQVAARTNMGTTNGSGTLFLTEAVIEATGCIEPESTDGETMDIEVELDGYVTKFDSFDWHDHVDNQIKDITDVEFSYVITDVTTEALEVSIIGSLDTALQVGDSSGLTTCINDDGTYFCPVPLAQSDGSLVARVQKNGYVDQNSASNYALDTATTRLTNDSAQVASEVHDIEYAVKVTATKEAGLGAADGAVVRVGAGFNVTCTEDGNSGVYYCVLPTGASGTSMDITKDGHVTQSQASGAYANRETNTVAQRTPSITDFQYGHRVDTNVTGATVTADDGDITCDADGDTYYCPIPLDVGNSLIRLAPAGFVSVTTTTPRRDDPTDIQVLVGMTSDDDPSFNYDYEGEGFSNFSIFPLAVTIENELGDDIEDASPTFDGEDFDVREGNVYYWSIADGTYALVVIRDGYVTDSSNNSVEVSSGTQEQIDVDLDYAYTISAITAEVLDTNLTTTVTTLELGDDTDTDECILNTGVWYCPVLLANSNGTLIARVAQSGYVDKSDYETTGLSSRSHDTAQDDGTIANILHAYKFSTFTSEATESDLASDVTAVWVGDDSENMISCTEGPGEGGDDIWYCVVPINLSDGEVIATPVIDGFVSGLHSVSVRDAEDDAQGVNALTDIEYAFKVTAVETEALEASLSNVTVSTGDAFAISCTELEGDWYCPVPLAHTGVTVRAEKDGYVTNEGAFFASDRVLAGDAQQEIAVESTQYSHRVTVTREGDGGPVSGASVTTTNTTCNEDDATGVYYCAVLLENDGNTIDITDGGYESDASLTATARDNNATAQVAQTKNNILFQLKVIVQDELNNAIDVDTLSTATFGGNAPTLMFGNIGYWAIETGDGTYFTLALRKDGYVDASVSNGNFLTAGGPGGVETTSENGQTIINLLGAETSIEAPIEDGESADAMGFQYALQVSVKEDWQTGGEYLEVEGATVSAGTSYGVACTEDSGGTYYCAIPTAGTATSARVVKSGFVTGFANYPDRTTASDAQGNITVYLGVPGGENQSQPGIADAYPQEGTVSISVNPWVEFNKPLSQMDTSTLTPSNIKICTTASLECAGVSATVQYANAAGDRTRVTILPNSVLAYDTTYFLVITENVRDVANNQLSVDGYGSYEFETAADGSDNTAPTIDSITPEDVDDVVVTIQPVIVFDEPMDSSTFQSSVVMLCASGEGCSPISAEVQTLEANTKARIMPNSPLSYNTSYWIRVTDEAQDLAGNNIDFGEDSFYDAPSFTTVAEPTGELAVTGISNTQTFATANNEWEDGFAWTFYVTIPVDDNAVAMKFSDFVSGDNTILADGNIRYCSEASENKDCESDDDWVTIATDNTYGDQVYIFSDLSDSFAGNQVEMKVQMKVPSSTPGGSYSGSYGVQSDEVEF